MTDLAALTALVPHVRDPSPAADSKPRGGGAAAPEDKAALRRAATAFEAAFLAEMLAHAGIGAPREGIGGGGEGERMFASFLTREYARGIAETGPLGLADAIEDALAERTGE